MLFIHSVYATYAPPLIRMRETRKTYKICSRHTIRNLRNAPVQLSWERNLQRAATFPSSSPGNTRPIPLLPNILTTCPKSPLLPNTLTTYPIIHTYPIHSQTSYYCLIYSRATQALPNISTAAQFTRHLYQYTDAPALNQGRGMLKQNILYQALTTQSADSEDPAV